MFSLDISDGINSCIDIADGESYRCESRGKTLSYKHWIQRVKKVLIFVSMPYTGLAEPLQLMALIKLKQLTK